MSFIVGQSHLIMTPTARLQLSFQLRLCSEYPPLALMQACRWMHRCFTVASITHQYNEKSH